MAGRKPYTPDQVVTLLVRGTLSAELDRLAKAGRHVEMCAFSKRSLRPALALANRIRWRQRTALRAATLAATWRVLSRQLAALELPWRRVRLGPGAWSVLVQDPDGAWFEAATVSAPIPQGFDDRPLVRVDSTGTSIMTDGRTLRIG